MLTFAFKPYDDVKTILQEHIHIGSNLADGPYCRTGCMGISHVQ